MSICTAMVSAYLPESTRMIRLHSSRMSLNLYLNVKIELAINNNNLIMSTTFADENKRKLFNAIKCLRYERSNNKCNLLDQTC